MISIKPKAAEEIPHFFKIGENYMVRTVTVVYTGKLVAVGPQEIVMENCSWIPDTGRFAQFVAHGTVNECEPYPDGVQVIIGRGALIDACIIDKLNRSQK